MTDFFYQGNRDSRSLRTWRRRRQRSPLGERIESREVIATAAALAALAAASTAGGAVAASAINSHATGKAAQLETDATNHAADVQKQSSDAQLAFARQQAENEYLNSEATRQANYDQWAAREGRLGTLGDMVGLGPRSIPAYVSGVDPHFDTGATPLPSGTPSASSATTSSSGDPIVDALAKNYASLGVAPTGRGTGPTDIAYMADRIRETGGLTPANTQYWFGPSGRIAQELAAAPGGGAAASSAKPYVSTAADLLAPAPVRRSPLTPALTVNPYRGGTIADLLGN